MTTTTLPRRRGRPRTDRSETDRGTPELLAKKQNGETAEIIDLCLERELITQHQHWCGIHLRWLYTLRHGTPTIRAIDPLHLGGIEIKESDPAWYELREKEFREAYGLLSRTGHAQLVSNICIYNECPSFFLPGNAPSYGQSLLATELLNHLRNGLDILVAHWQRK